jgi:hypothetical protein
MIQVPDKAQQGDQKQQLREILAQKSKIRQRKKEQWPEGTTGQYNHFINVAVMIFFQLFSSHKINTKVAEQVKNGPIERECRWFD